MPSSFMILFQAGLSLTFPMLLDFTELTLSIPSKRVSISRSEPAATAKSLQSCPTLCDPIDGSLPGSLVLGILQARVLEWGAIAFSEE